MMDSTRTPLRLPTNDALQNDAVLDVRGLKCPLPVLYLEKALRTLSPGARIVMVADDPLARLDIPNAVRASGDHLEKTEQDAQALLFFIRKGQAR